MKLDAVTLAVMNNRLAAIADEMGVVLGQTGFSPNIKERHDFSCAMFDGRGELVAQAAHIPVHLGSTPLSVRAAIANLELLPRRRRRAERSVRRRNASAGPDAGRADFYRQ